MSGLVNSFSLDEPIRNWYWLCSNSFQKAFITTTKLPVGNFTLVPGTIGLGVHLDGLTEYFLKGTYHMEKEDKAEE